ncbi:hypothetical protein PHET_08427 [Paragonimus heterotremus]|uniref:Septin-type G domain-containing protein n=1 Tax=Paragonimus heterotremus TaxID=100268 RepID=A0A8J4SJ10_9TREM|nr:hypothetical protein PHET_08427 [Paragonimus heterotremus]
MKALQNKVNVIPVIAKSDTITKTELQEFKPKILSEIQTNGINIYQFPTDDVSVSEVNAQMNDVWISQTADFSIKMKDVDRI